MAIKDFIEKAKAEIEKSDIDEKLGEFAGDIKDMAVELKDKAKAEIDKTDFDEKVVAKAKELKDKAETELAKTDFFDKKEGK